MAQYLIDVKKEITPFLEMLAKEHNVTVERWVSVWLETAVYQAVAMTDVEAIARLEDEKIRASIQHLLKRMRDGEEN